MKDPHDKSQYVKSDDAQPEPQSQAENADQNGGVSDVEPRVAPQTEPKKKKKYKFSGAYYYVDTDEKKLAEHAFARTVLTIIALMLQIVILFLPAQDSLEYVTLNLASYALFYVMAVFVMLAISIWLIIMNMTRYKFLKRIPVEYAPKHGFKRRAFFGAELYIAINALLTAMQISFVCIKYDPITLVAVFLSAAATAAAVVARQVTHIALKNAELIPASSDTAAEPVATPDN